MIWLELSFCTYYWKHSKCVVNNWSNPAEFSECESWEKTTNRTCNGHLWFAKYCFSWIDGWKICVRCMLMNVQLCLTLCDPMDCSPPGSPVHGIFQARILEWIAISSSRGSSWPRDQTCVSCLLHWQANSLPQSPGKHRKYIDRDKKNMCICDCKWKLEKSKNQFRN